MSEWWTYRPSDFLLFSARTYYRLFELYNAEVWPAHLVAAALGLSLLVLAIRGGGVAPRAAFAILAVCWLWVAWAFHLQRYATVNWAASWFAAAFVLEGLLLLATGVFGDRRRLRAGRGLSRAFGFGLLVFALFVHPTIAALLGRPWMQAEVFGLAPDPTAVATLAILLLFRSYGVEADRKPANSWVGLLPWPIPVAWCAFSGMTLWTMR